MKLYRDDGHSIQFLILPTVCLHPICALFNSKNPQNALSNLPWKMNSKRETMNDAMESKVQQSITIF